MASVQYLFDDDRPVAPDAPLDLTPYPTLDELLAAEPDAAPADRDWLRDMRPADWAFAAALALVTLGWLAMIAAVAWHVLH